MGFPPKLQPIADLATVLSEVHSPNDRIAGIVGSAYLENYLAWALRFRMRRKLSETTRRALFDEGSLGDFGVKIDLAYALNIIGDLARSDFKRIAKRSSPVLAG